MFSRRHRATLLMNSTSFAFTSAGFSDLSGIYRCSDRLGKQDSA